MNKKGFTLMEILAVLLILALVSMFAIPAIRQVRSMVQYQQAKSAALKLGEAIRSYYKNTRGYYITGSVLGKEESGAETNLASNATSVACSNPAATGIPSNSTGTSESNIKQLFACDYVSVKDFIGLPYEFTANKPSSTSDVLVTVTGTASAGRYKNKSFTVHLDGSVKEVKEVD